MDYWRSTGLIGLDGLYTEDEVLYLFEEPKQKPLPVLPREIISKILYEFGGLEHPLSKTFKQVKTSMPTIEVENHLIYQRAKEQDMWFRKHFNLKNKIYKYSDGDYCEYIKGNILNFFSGYGIDFNQIKPLEQTGIIIKPTKTVRDFVFYHLRLKEEEYKKKDLQDYLDENKIKWYKSWSKKRLMKATMIF